jgi:hypothetical protein
MAGLVMHAETTGHLDQLDRTFVIVGYSSKFYIFDFNKIDSASCLDA